MATPSDDLTRIQRWEDAGAVWRVLARRSGSLTVALCQCDGGQEVGRFTTREPDALAFVGQRDSNEDAG